MTAKSFCMLAAAIFALMALVQVARAVMGWPVAVLGYEIPFWPNWIAFAVLAGLSVLGFKAAGRG